MAKFSQFGREKALVDTIEQQRETVFSGD